MAARKELEQREECLIEAIRALGGREAAWAAKELADAERKNHHQKETDG
jgi:hypothetical protein